MDKRTQNLVWLQSGGCGGCTMSLLCSGANRLFDQLGDAGIRVLWHPALSEQSGAEALALGLPAPVRKLLS